MVLVLEVLEESEGSDTNFIFGSVFKASLYLSDYRLKAILTLQLLCCFCQNVHIVFIVAIVIVILFYFHFLCVMLKFPTNASATPAISPSGCHPEWFSSEG